MQACVGENGAEKCRGLWEATHMPAVARAVKGLWTIAWYTPHAKSPR